MTFNLTTTAHMDLKNEALKRRLIECVHAETENFIQVAEAFYQLGRRTETDYKKLCQAVISTIDQVLSADQWSQSLFLRNTLKPLHQLRELAVQLQQDMRDAEPASYAPPRVASNDIQLYVSLYQTNGHDLNQWALQLASLSSYMIGRPIYQQEQDVQQMIRAKPSQTSEAYVIVIVARDKMITDSQSRTRKDRYGHALIALLPNAISSENIVEFVHHGKCYAYRDGQLAPILKRMAS